uniref:HDC09517 n=1 Tax=Drosophila melanogaster TaxID=7227 RepID=Q6ILE7_DROME|nr:TPA_inf: HDC09517 [Drosophila melanogaster]
MARRKQGHQDEVTTGSCGSLRQGQLNGSSFTQCGCQRDLKPLTVGQSQLANCLIGYTKPHDK